MTAADHGTNARYIAGCHCDRCSDASYRYHKRKRHLHANGIALLIDSTVTTRQLQGLMALGWPGSWIAEQLGHGYHLPLRPTVTRRFAADVDALSRRVGDTWGPSEKSRGWARKHGYRVPAWWDEDWQTPPPPPPLPSPSRERRQQRLDEVQRLTALGMSAQQIADRLGIGQRLVSRDRQRLARMEQAA